MRSTVTMKIRSQKSMRVIIIRSLTFFGGFLKMFKKRQKTHYNHSDEFLFQIFMVIVDRIKNRGFFFSQKLKKSKSRLKNGGSHAPVFNFKRGTPRK